jgi:hypothetical protein
VRAAPGWPILHRSESLPGTISAMEWHSAGRLAIGLNGEGLRVRCTNGWYDIAEETWQIAGTAPHAAGVSWSPDGERLAVIDFTGTAFIYQFTDDERALGYQAGMIPDAMLGGA